VTRQYDRYVRGNTAQAMPDDAGVVRVDEASGRGVALSTDCNARFVELDPYAGAQLALAEAYRNVAVSGARPLAVSDCLNFGSPEDPGVMWQFAQAVTGLADGCLELAIPVTGGNVSFYNQTGDLPIHPTPVVAVLGVLDDVADRNRSGWSQRGQALYLLGRTCEELDGSLWSQVVHDHLGGRPPVVDLAAERLLAGTVLSATSAGLVHSAHDLSEGGLAVALAEGVLRHGVGAEVSMDSLCTREGVDPFTALFSESAARALVAVAADDAAAFEALCAEQGQAAVHLGVTAGGSDAAAGSLLVQGCFELSVEHLLEARTGVIEAALCR
jgi:phosphoribosylformylglycinamidine synthase